MVGRFLILYTFNIMYGPKIPKSMILSECIYEAQTLLGLGVSWCRIRVGIDTGTYNYIEFCDFLKLLSVSVFGVCAHAS
jgi:hypothetical protein